MDRATGDEDVPAGALDGALDRLLAAVDRHRGAVQERMGLGEKDLQALYALSTDGPLTPGDLGRRLNLRSASVTALVDRLETAGHAVRERHPDDRRSVRVRITPSAFQRGAEEFGPFAGALHGAAQRLAPADRAAVLRWLEAVTAVYDEHAGQGVRE